MNGLGRLSLVMLLPACGELEIGSYASDEPRDPVGGEPDRSCRDPMLECGAEPTSCCAALRVESESFTLGREEVDGSWADAYVSKFFADIFEVSVARFAAFVASYDEWRGAGNPGAGAGVYPFVSDSGWHSRWDQRLPASQQELVALLESCEFATFPGRASDPQRPMNCVSWYEAFAFCIWDGKRLLTQAEWELGAKGGAEDRPYPWGSSEPNIDLAVHGCIGDAGGSEICELGDILPVGSKPLGVSRDGLFDLSGSVAEWVFDASGSGADLYPNPCDNCANASDDAERMFRGGGWMSRGVALAADAPASMDAAARIDFVGLRCARTVP
jgi:formylglycine-generating enzyme